jgi:hypothetical protein
MSEPIKRYRFDEAVSLEDFDGPWVRIVDHERIVNELRAEAMSSDEWHDKALELAAEGKLAALSVHLRRRIKEQE